MNKILSLLVILVHFISSACAPLPKLSTDPLTMTPETGARMMFLHPEGIPEETIVIVFNFTPVPRQAYRVGVPHGGLWKEILNSDGDVYGGTGVGNRGQAIADEAPFQGRPYSLLLSLPPLGALFFKGEETPS